MATQTLIDALSANATARSALVASLIPDAVIPPVIVPTATGVVHPMKGLTNCVYLDEALGVPWRRETGDWIDKSGTVNGGVPTLVVPGGSTVTVDISALPVDLYLQGPHSISKVVIDGADVTQACFAAPAGAGSAYPLPTQSNWSVIVPNSGGKSMQVTSDASVSWRIDAVATPKATILSPVGGFTPPDLLRIDPTSFASVVIPGSIPAASSAANRCFAGVVSYETDRGVTFARAHCQATYYPAIGAGRVARCDYPLAPQTEMYVAYLLRLGPRVPYAVTDLGVKLSGMSGDEGRWNIGEHINTYYNLLRNLRNMPIMALRDYYYSAEATSGQGAGDGQSSPFSFGYLPLDWVHIEHGVRANTFTNGVPNADGRKTTKINGNLVEDRAIKWFANPTSRWNMMSYQIYHGGIGSYSEDCYYDIGPYMASTKPIGIDPAFLPLLAQ